MFTEELAREIYDKTAGRCVHCDKVLTFANRGRSGRAGWEIDHSVPKARGGTDHFNNLNPSCWKCNIKKSTRPSRAHRITVAGLRQKRTATRRFRIMEQAILPAFAIAAFVFNALKPDASTGPASSEQRAVEQERLFWKRLLFTVAAFAGVILIFITVRELSRRV